MDNSGPFKEEKTEEEAEVDVSDLPEVSNARGSWSLWLSRTFLGWQHSLKRGSWRLVSTLGTVVLVIAALFVFLSSVYSLFAPPANRAVQLSPTPTPRIIYRNHPEAVYRGQFGFVLNVAWSPDGTRLASGSRNGTVQVWDTKTGKRLFTYRGHSNEVLGVAWSPDGTRIASASRDTTVQVWDASTGKRLLTYRGHTNAVYSVAWSPYGTRIASGGDDGTVQVWDANSGKR